MSKFIRDLVLACGLLALPIVSSFADSRDWNLQDIKGERYRLSEHLGSSPFVLVFWATWCVPCKKEMDDQRPLFEGLMKQGVNVLFVAEDNQKSQAKVKPYVESKGYKWPVLLDPDGEILKRYGGTTSIPYTVVLDRDGAVQSKLRGAIKNADNFRNQVTKLMEKSGE
jgi:peroxiredoxin